VNNVVEKKLVGRIAHYFSKIGVAVIELSADLKVGDTIRIEGGTTAFEQRVDSIEIEKQKLEAATGGQAIGLKVKEKVRPNDSVYKLTRAE
jgi:translation elongation factor EF-1alpha